MVVSVAALVIVSYPGRSIDASKLVRAGQHAIIFATTLTQ